MYRTHTLPTHGVNHATQTADPGKSRDSTRRHSRLEGVRTTGDEHHTSAHSVRQHNQRQSRERREHRADGSHASGHSVASSPSTARSRPSVALDRSGAGRGSEARCRCSRLQEGREPASSHPKQPHVGPGDMQGGGELSWTVSTTPASRRAAGYHGNGQVTLGKEDVATPTLAGPGTC